MAYEIICDKFEYSAINFSGARYQWSSILSAIEPREEEGHLVFDISESLAWEISNAFEEEGFPLLSPSSGLFNSLLNMIQNIV